MKNTIDCYVEKYKNCIHCNNAMLTKFSEIAKYYCDCLGYWGNHSFCIKHYINKYNVFGEIYFYDNINNKLYIFIFAKVELKVEIWCFKTGKIIFNYKTNNLYFPELFLTDPGNAEKNLQNILLLV